MKKRVLVSDKLSEESVKIFIDRGIEVDYLPDLGKDKEKLSKKNFVINTSKGKSFSNLQTLKAIKKIKLLKKLKK